MNDKTEEAQPVIDPDAFPPLGLGFVIDQILAHQQNRDMQEMLLAGFAERRRQIDFSLVIDALTKINGDFAGLNYITDAAYVRFRHQIAGAISLLRAMNHHGNLFNQEEHPIQQPKNRPVEDETSEYVEEAPATESTEINQAIP